MAKTYNGIDHTWVMVNHPQITLGQINEKGDRCWSMEGWKGPQHIVLHTGPRVWIEGSYAMEGHDAVVRVGDCRCNGYDEHGNCILSIPAEWCVGFYNDEEATNIMQCMDADDRLLGYAT